MSMNENILSRLALRGVGDAAFERLLQVHAKVTRVLEDESVLGPEAYDAPTLGEACVGEAVRECLAQCLVRGRVIDAQDALKPEGRLERLPHEAVDAKVEVVEVTCPVSAL